MDYVIGDVQGADVALGRLLDAIGFSASRDRIHLLGDLVNRGPDSLAVLRRLRALGDSAVCLLGNHDWHLLAVAAGVRRKHRSDTFDDVLDAPDRDDWLAWLRAQRMAVHAHGWLMLHAGVVPQWTLAETLALAGDLERALREAPQREFLDAMFGNEPTRWSDALDATERLRFTLNTLTRIRFLDAEGKLDFAAKGAPASASAGLVPWFDAADRATAGVPIAFGHWSTLDLIVEPTLLAIDTGCAWGGQLTAVRIDGGRREVFQVDCG